MKKTYPPFIFHLLGLAACAAPAATRTVRPGSRRQTLRAQNRAVMSAARR